MDRFDAARARDAQEHAERFAQQAREKQARMIAAIALEEAERAKQHMLEKQRLERLAQEQRNLAQGYRNW